MVVRSATKKKDQKPITSAVERNIRSISTLESRELAKRTRGERISDRITEISGRIWFINIHAAGFVLWIMLNSRVIRFIRPFDPYPFQFLTLVVSLEAIFLSLFILMSQNRATRQADERASLDLQINLLAEHEATKMLQMLRSLCAHHDLPEAKDPEVTELCCRTNPDEVMAQVKAQMIDSSKN